jgi:hypothetical protein
MTQGRRECRRVPNGRPEAERARAGAHLRRGIGAAGIATRDAARGGGETRGRRREEIAAAAVVAVASKWAAEIAAVAVHFAELLFGGFGGGTHQTNDGSGTQAGQAAFPARKGSGTI